MKTVIGILALAGVVLGTLGIIYGLSITSLDAVWSIFLEPGQILIASSFLMGSCLITLALLYKD